MKYSDLIVPHGVKNEIAIEFITENLKNKLLKRGILMNNKNEDKRQNGEVVNNSGQNSTKTNSES